VLLAGFVSLSAAEGLEIVNAYSPRNSERPRRNSTEYLILHTTEGPKKGSLKKLRLNGETHCLVDRGGRVYRIIEKGRVALHTGRSLWDGRRNLDECSIGVEVVGYHNGTLTAAQIRALKELLAQLQRLYGIPDARVLTHSMVAYGTPNRWHRKSHRGRKRCGMLFADPSLRRQLGLTDQPAHDPDVRAGRLVVGDPSLARMLYGSGDRRAGTSAAGPDVISTNRSAWDIARDKYASTDTVYVLPNGDRQRGDQIRDWRRLPVGTRVILSERQSENEPEGVRQIGRDGPTARDIAGDEFTSSTTVYFLPSGAVKRGDELGAAQLEGLPAGTRMLVGVVYGGYVKSDRSAFDICGTRWNFPSTFYRLPDGSIRSGAELDEKAIPKQTLVFFQN